MGVEKTKLTGELYITDENGRQRNIGTFAGLTVDPDVLSGHSVSSSGCCTTVSSSDYVVDSNYCGSSGTLLTTVVSDGTTLTNPSKADHFHPKLAGSLNGIAFNGSDIVASNAWVQGMNPVQNTYISRDELKSVVQLEGKDMKAKDVDGNIIGKVVGLDVITGEVKIETDRTRGRMRKAIVI